jgi:hypothetical protein
LTFLGDTVQASTAPLGSGRSGVRADESVRKTSEAVIILVIRGISKPERAVMRVPRSKNVIVEVNVYKIFEMTSVGAFVISMTSPVKKVRREFASKNCEM